MGNETTFATLPTYVTGSNPHSAVLYIHDVLGWKFGNARLLADHFAKEVCWNSSIASHQCLLKTNSHRRT